jgi:arylsulfatase A-like enzyme
MFKKRVLLPILHVFCLSYAFGQTSSKPNILFIAIDDLNDWTGSLKGHPQTKTPNMDALASQSVVFSKAYCNSPSCNPSRSSILLGKHPHSLGFYRITDIDVPGGATIDMRQYWADKKTLPQYFKDNGYTTQGTGKIFHLFGDMSTTIPRKELSFEQFGSGSTNINTGKNIPRQGAIVFGDVTKENYKDYGAIDSAHSKFGDYERASIAIDYINKPHDKPFFIACGFYLPHLPWYYPKDILDSAALSGIKDYNNVILPKVLANDLDDLSEIGRQTALNGGTGTATWKGTTYPNSHAAWKASGTWKEGVQAYLASIYFVDLQLGRVLKALNNSKYKDNTIVILWSDHGWMLGQKEGWEKFKPWEQSVRVPFMIKAPGIKPAVVDKPVELLSIFPTLVDLTGIPKKDGLDGVSLKPLLENPSMKWEYPIITANRESNGGWQTVRTKKYRYIRYMKNGEEELYDHTTDSLEWYNIANNPQMASVKAELNAYLPKTWTALGSWNNWETPVNIRNSKKTHSQMPIRINSGRLYFTLKNNESRDLHFFDVKGNRLFEISSDVLSKNKNKGYVELPAALVGSGIYIIQFVSGREVYSEKFVLNESY